MLASDIRRQARSIAKLQKTDMITREDDLTFMQESETDLYVRMCEAPARFNLLEREISIDSTMKKDQTTWVMPLPSDVYKIKTVDYFYAGRWHLMKTYALTERNSWSTEPLYSLENNNLKLIMNPSLSVDRVRVGYYPPVPTVSLPDETVPCLQDLAEYDLENVGALVSVKSRTDYGLLYVFNKGIYFESANNKSTYPLYTTLNAITHIAYNRGFIYWRESDGSVYRSSTTLYNQLTQTFVVSARDVYVFNEKVWYTTPTEVHSTNLDGTGDQVAVEAVNPLYVSPYSTSFAYISEGAVWIDDIPSYVSAMLLAGDGKNLYILDNKGSLRSILLDTDGSVLDNYILKENVVYFGAPAGDRIPTCSADDGIDLFSTFADTDFSYPLNVAYEIIVWQLARDYLTKMEKDTGAVTARLGELWARFNKEIKKDGHLPIRMGIVSPQVGYY